MTLFHGHDYNKARSDLREAREAYDTLVALGFTAPVDAFEPTPSTPTCSTTNGNGQRLAAMAARASSAAAAAVSP